MVRCALKSLASFAEPARGLPRGRGGRKFLGPSTLVVLAIIVVGCETAPPSNPASRQREKADLIVSFQSWKFISFIKPDVTGTAGALTARKKTFTRDGFVKLLNNLKTPRGFVVVVLDRRYSPDPMTAGGGLDAIRQFFAGLGFGHIVIQDGTAIERDMGQAILRDTTMQ
jgi:hypothetical protein